MTDDNLRDFWFWFSREQRIYFRDNCHPGLGMVVSGTVVRKIPGWVSCDFCPRGVCSCFLKNQQIHSKLLSK